MNVNLAQARLNACRRWPAATGAILSLIPIERKGLGTLAVDKQWRLYFDPEYVASQPSEELIGLILHEVSHLLLAHHQRRGGRDPELWNVAADLTVNDRLLTEGHALPPDGQFVKDYQLPGNLSAEQYFRHLEDRRDVKRKRETSPQTEAGDEPTEQGAEDESGTGQEPGDQPYSAQEGQDAEGDAGAADGSAGAGDGGAGEAGESQVAGDAGEPAGDCGQSAGGQSDGEGGSSAGSSGSGYEPVSPGVSGSCSDGIAKPWELPPDDETPAIAEHEAEQIRQAVAEQIEKAKGGGKGNGWADWSNNILHPKVDPKQLLIAAVRKAAEQTSGGHDDTSYRRPCRRPSIGGVIRPGRVALIPRICLIIDSSGSMDQRDLGLALGMVSKVLSGFRLRDGIQVMVGDCAVQSCEKVFDPKKIIIKGRGGTEVDLLIRAAVELTPKPQLVVCLTDGFTGWPREPVGIPVVACLTQDRKLSSVPSWIKSIVLS